MSDNLGLAAVVGTLGEDLERVVEDRTASVVASDASGMESPSDDVHSEMHCGVQTFVYRVCRSEYGRQHRQQTLLTQEKTRYACVC